jgi:hypothetical protein
VNTVYVAGPSASALQILVEYGEFRLVEDEVTVGILDVPRRGFAADFFAISSKHSPNVANHPIAKRHARQFYNGRRDAHRTSVLE